MSTGETAELLVEIGTEELPPKALAPLKEALRAGLVAALDEERLAHGEALAYATPRRLAVRIAAVAARQPDREVEQKGPPVSIAFGDDGQPTKAARAFADKSGVPVRELSRESTPKGEWLVYRATEPGRALAEVFPDCLSRALAGLPIPRRMRWGASEAEFVRPLHWLLALHGREVLPAEALGIRAGRRSRGHRFMAPGEIEFKSAAEYPQKLGKQGRVIASFEERRERIVAAVREAAAAAGGEAVAPAGLFDEVTALTEWPVAVTGRFDERFLELPREVIVATLTSHQRYFPLAEATGKLIPAFVAIANLDSPEPGKVRDGNERVIRPRLADAAFFWDADRAMTLDARRRQLADVVYQQGLGTLGDRSRRIALLAGRVAGELDQDPAVVERAALLAKCDLLTGMVGEFPELQGTMGGYYALADGEPEAVASAIGEQYLPRFAGDELPGSRAGQVLALADKLDTLAGAFATGKKPSGNRDPFGLRRAALGVVRILVERRLDLDLPGLVASGLELQPVEAAEETGRELVDFVVERLRGWYLERNAFTPEMFEAVRARGVPSLVDFDARLHAVAGFVENDAAESLAAANKRIANILRQAGYSGPATPDGRLFAEEAEAELDGALARALEGVRPLLAERRYADALTELARLRGPVDRFFDEVMVMAEDESVRENRLALLARLREQFLDVADISRLSIGRG